MSILALGLDTCHDALHLYPIPTAQKALPNEILKRYIPSPTLEISIGLTFELKLIPYSSLAICAGSLSYFSVTNFVKCGLFAPRSLPLAIAVATAASLISD